MIDENEIQQWISDAMGFLKGEHPDKEQFTALNESLAEFAESCELDSTRLTKAGRVIIYFSDEPVELGVDPIIDCTGATINAKVSPMVYRPRETDHRGDVLAGVELADRLLIRLRTEHTRRKTDTTRKNTVPLPSSVDARDLCKLLQDVPAKERTHGWQIETALGFTKGDRKMADNLLRTARDCRHLWVKNGHTDTKRTHS